jgi:hypothetical protein
VSGVGVASIISRAADHGFDSSNAVQSPTPLYKENRPLTNVPHLTLRNSFLEKSGRLHDYCWRLACPEFSWRAACRRKPVNTTSITSFIRLAECHKPKGISFNPGSSGKSYLWMKHAN